MERDECDVCQVIPTGAKGLIPEAHADACVLAIMENRPGFILCVEHYGRMFWPGTTGYQVVAF